MACAPLVAPTTARAGGAVLAPAGQPEPAMSVRMAVAIGPTSTTRWSEITIPAGPALGWLVPVRPGATVEWAPNAWLAALDGASAPRVLVPEYPAPCSLHQSFEVPPPWVKPAAPVPSAAIALPASADDVGTWADGHGLSVSPAEMKRLGDLYASGWRVAAVELEASDGPRSSPTLRVTDDGGAILPLSIGVSAVDTNVTLFVVGDGTASIAGTRDLDDSAISWGASGSSYALVRKQLIGRDGWLRESASHAALFTQVALLPRPTVAPVVVAPAVTTYFDDPACAAQVQSLGTSPDAQDPASLTCGERKDLSLALAGIAPESAVLTRLAGVLPGGLAAGTPEIALGSALTRASVRRATSYDHPCPADGVDVDSPEPDPPSSTGIREPSSSSSTSHGGGGGGGGGGSYSNSGTTVYVPSDGCSGGTTTVVEGDDDDDDTTTDGWDSSDSSSDACSGDTSSSSTDGWDSSDSSSDDCSGDTSSSSDGWDSSDSSCTTARHKKRRGPSPLSRLIMVAVTLLIPLRRLSRRRSGECS